MSETKTKAKGRTKEQIYREQMQALGIYEEIFEPEIKTLARVEREYTRAEKAWSDTAAPGGKPSFLDPHYAIIQRLRAEILQRREALGLTPKALRKLAGAAGSDAPQAQDLIASKLDRIAEAMAQYDAGDPFAALPDAQAAAEIADRLDEELAAAVAEDMG